MKKIYYLLTVLPFIACLISLLYLPNQIPMHFNAAGIITRYGSKYESLLLPIITLLFGFGGVFAAKLASKNEENNNKNNEMIVFYVFLTSLIVFNSINAFILYTGFNNTQNINELGIPFHKIIFSLLGLMLIVTGNLMPKTRRNKFVGLRTPWALNSEKAWKKSQRFGGQTFVLSGFLIIIGNLFISKFEYGMIYSISIIILDGILSLIYTFYLSKDKKNMDTLN